MFVATKDGEYKEVQGCIFGDCALDTGSGRLATCDGVDVYGSCLKSYGLRSVHFLMQNSGWAL